MNVAIVYFDIPGQFVSTDFHHTIVPCAPLTAGTKQCNSFN